MKLSQVEFIECINQHELWLKTDGERGTQLSPYILELNDIEIKKYCYERSFYT